MLLKTFNMVLQQGPGGPAEPGIILLVAGLWKGLEHPRGGAGQPGQKTLAGGAVRIVAIDQPTRKGLAF